MIREVHLKNFKSFTDSTFNFIGKNNLPKKIILLYGANGSGKTNFIELFAFLSDIMQTLNTKRMLMDIIENSNNINQSVDWPSVLQYYSIENLISEYKTINSKSNMCIELSFLLDEKIGTYYIEFDDKQILREKLEYTLQKNKGVYFDFSLDDLKINNTFFNVDIQLELKSLARKYWGKHSILAILNYLETEYSQKYIEDNIGQNLINTLHYFQSIICHLADQESESDSLVSFNSLVSSFDEGEIIIDDIPKLDASEKVINYFFTHLYNDVAKVYYKRDLIDNNKIKYCLQFQKKLQATTVDLDYDRESDGTKRLIELLPFFLSYSKNIVVAIDEIDTGIHDLLITKLVFTLLPFIKGQLILTTHNTGFIENYELRESVYTINISDDYTKTIKPITENLNNYRIQKSSDILGNYKEGTFGGIPNITDFDFHQISQYIE